MVQVPPVEAEDCGSSKKARSLEPVASGDSNMSGMSNECNLKLGECTILSNFAELRKNLLPLVLVVQQQYVWYGQTPFHFC